MRSVVPMKTAKTGYVVISLLLILFGFLVCLKPQAVGTFLGVVIGIAMLLFGIVKIVGYFSKDLFRLAFQYDLAFGLLLIALGVIVLTKPAHLMLFICIGIGIAILADGLFKVQMSVDAKQFGIKKWWLILLTACITGILGLMLIFNAVSGSVVLMRLLGIALIGEGVLSLITVFTSVKIVKYQKPDILEGDWREI